MLFGRTESGLQVSWSRCTKGVRPKSTFSLDETWVERNTCDRYKTQKGRNCYRESTRVGSVSGKPEKAYKSENAGG